MKRLILLLSIFFSMGVCAGWKPLVFPTLAVNTGDQLTYVMPHRPVVFPAVSEVETGQPYSVDLCVGIEKKLTEPLKLTGSLKVISPDGSSQDVFSDISVIMLKEGSIGLFPLSRFIRAEFEKSDLPGKYDYILTLKDAAGNEKSAKVSLTLVKSITDPAPMNKEEFSKFFDFYYRSPKPQRLLAAWEYYLGEGVAEQRKREGNNFNPTAVLNGFSEAFKLNPHFYDELAALSRKAPEGKHGYYVMVFAGQGKEVVEKYKNAINPAIISYIEQCGYEPFSFKEVVHGSQLDILWTEFFITGKFEPVKRLTAELRQRPEMSVAEVKKRNEAKQPLTAEEMRNFMNFITRSAAVWSLQANLKQGHLLLGYYLETVCYRELYADRQAAALLAAILENINSKKEEKK